MIAFEPNTVKCLIVSVLQTKRSLVNMPRRGDTTTGTLTRPGMKVRVGGTGTPGNGVRVHRVMGNGCTG